MPSVVYNVAKSGLMDGTIDLDNDIIRVALLMTNTTAGAGGVNTDAANVDDITTLDRFNGASYSDLVLANPSVNADIQNDRGEYDADDLTFSGIGAGTRNVSGLLVYQHNTDDTDAVPICFIVVESFNGNGGDVTIQWDAEGILQAT